METKSEVLLGEAWTLEQLVSVARGEALLCSTEAAERRIRRARAVVDALADAAYARAQPVYPVTGNVPGIARGDRASATRAEEEQPQPLPENRCGVGAAEMQGQGLLRSRTRRKEFGEHSGAAWIL